MTNIRFLIGEEHEFQPGSVIRLLRTRGEATVHGAEGGSADSLVVRDADRPVQVARVPVWFDERQKQARPALQSAQ